MTTKIYLATDETGLTLGTVGTIAVWDGTEFVNFPAGPDGDALVADSTSPSGLAYASAGGGVDPYLVINSGPPESGFYGFPGDVLLARQPGVVRQLVVRYLVAPTRDGIGSLVLSPDVTSESNIAIVLNPQGLGGLQAQAADGTVVGGNARGTRAVDWQQERAAATQVASGIYAVIGGGLRNTASGTVATVGGGSSNTASGNSATVGGGSNNTASQLYATVGGGQLNTASNGSSAVGGGQSNTASSAYATVGGGAENTVSGDYATVAGGYRGRADQYGMFCHASGRFAATGDAQYSRMILRRQTADATPTVLSANGGSPASVTLVALANNTGYQFIVQVMARDTSGTDSAWWVIRGGVIKDATSASTTLIGTNITETSATPGAAAWTVTATADTTNGALSITATGALGVTIRWVATVHLDKVSF